MQGLSRALTEEVTFNKSNVTSLDWVTYPMVRFKDAPKVYIHGLTRTDVPDPSGPGSRTTGSGEPALPPVAPAIANAFFDATGVRIYEAPMTPGPRPRGAEGRRRRIAVTTSEDMERGPSGPRSLSCCGFPLLTIECGRRRPVFLRSVLWRPLAREESSAGTRSLRSSSSLSARERQPTRQAPGLPLHGVLAPGVSLAGIHIGDTTAKVKSVWGRNYKLCPDCKGTYWYYIYTHGEPLGAAVKFSKAGRVVAAFTLGSPIGWRTSEGLGIGEQIDKVTSLYGQVGWHVCLGYGAMSMRNSNTVTSIYTTRPGGLRLRDHRAHRIDLSVVPTRHQGRAEARRDDASRALCSKLRRGRVLDRADRERRDRPALAEHDHVDVVASTCSSPTVPTTR